MKCPYCTEEIQQDAIVCKFCHRDLVFYLPVAKRLNELEGKINQLEVSITKILEGFASQDGKVIVRTEDRSSILFYIAALLIGGVIATVFYNIYIYLPSTRPLSLWSSILLPSIIGIWIGLVSPPKRLTNYFFLGIGAGAINSLGIYFSVSHYVSNLSIESRVDFERVITLYFLAPFFLVILGGFIGDWIQGKRTGRGSPPSYAVSAAKVIVNTSGNKNNEVQRAEKIEKYIAALTPLLTFIASIISAVLTFLATIASTNSN